MIGRKANYARELNVPENRIREHGLKINMNLLKRNRTLIIKQFPKIYADMDQEEKYNFLQQLDEQETQ